jgi:hypothetical protein
MGYIPPPTLLPESKTRIDRAWFTRAPSPPPPPLSIKRARFDEKKAGKEEKGKENRESRKKPTNPFTVEKEPLRPTPTGYVGYVSPYAVSANVMFPYWIWAEDSVPWEEYGKGISDGGSVSGGSGGGGYSGGDGERGGDFGGDGDSGF